MLKPFRTAGVVLCSVVFLQPVHAGASDDKAAIERVLSRYEQALNGADREAVVELYTQNGVQMAPDAPVAQGSEQVADAYDGIFATISLNLTFATDEVQVFDANHAMMRSHSWGTLSVNGTNQPAANVAFKELWLLDKTEGEWKFSHYSFSAMPVAN